LPSPRHRLYQRGDSVVAFCIMLMLGPAEAQADSWEDCNQKGGEFDRVIGACSKIIDKGDETVQGHQTRSEICVCILQPVRGQPLNEAYDFALADCKKAIELDPKFASAYGERCYVYQTIKDYD
jgi:hypothetical protein